MFNPPNTYYTDQRLTGDQVNENTISHFKYLLVTLKNYGEKLIFE